MTTLLSDLQAVNFLNITNRPHTLAGYGITDANVNSIVETERVIPATTISPITIDLVGFDSATVFKVFITVNCSLVFINPPIEISSTKLFSFSVMTVNDSVGGKSMAFANTIKWPGGIIPPRTTNPNAIDVWTFFIENGEYYGSLSILNAL